MNHKPKVDLSKFEAALTVVDSHTEGEFTRIVVGGMPEIKGDTMLEKQAYIREHYDHIRTALMLEPRGHKDMFGAFITEPVHEEADFGVVYMESEAYPNMCGHGTIGCATMAVETGLVKAVEPYTDVVLDAPAGIVRTRVKVEDGRAVAVSLMNVPAFVYAEGLETVVNGVTYKYDIAFGGQFFAMVDVEQTGLDINKENINKLVDIGIEIMHNVNREQKFSHPTLPISDMTSMEFYGKPHGKDADVRNVVCFGNHQADRSPCGTGTSAKLALLYKHGEIEVGQKIRSESFMDSVFTGEIKETTKIGDFDAVVPEITGSAYLTGVGTYLIDPTDPLKYGFIIG
jgi:proline racemase